MRSCLYLLGLLGAILAQPIVSAQGVIPNNSRGAAGPPAAVPVATPTATGVGRSSIAPNTALGAADEVSVLIKEDQDKPWTLVVSDQGEVTFGSMGSVAVAGKTSAAAAAAISAYLKRDYYHEATVQVQILKKAPGSVPQIKVMMDGKLSRPGPIRFNEGDPITLSEAVTLAMPTEWANLKRVQLTRSGQQVEYNVEAMIKGGRVDLDVKLRDGDRIYVPKRGWVTSSGD